MKKLVLGILIGIASTVFVQKNKWCQEKLQKLEEKGKEFVGNRCNCQKEEEQPATEEPEKEEKEKESKKKK